MPPFQPIQNNGVKKRLNEDLECNNSGIYAKELTISGLLEDINGPKVINDNYQQFSNMSLSNIAPHSRLTKLDASKAVPEEYDDDIDLLINDIQGMNQP